MLGESDHSGRGDIQGDCIVLLPVFRDALRTVCSLQTADKLLGQASDSVMKEIAQTERGDGYLRSVSLVSWGKMR